MGSGTEPKLSTAAASFVALGMVDRELQIAIDLIWSESVNRTVVEPRMMGIANQIKGKMAVFTSEYSWQSLAAAGPKALKDPERLAFPRGTADRKSNSGRFGLEYPPAQRVSLFVDLLPYMGRGQLSSMVNKNYAWYAFEQEAPDPTGRLGRVLVDNLSPGGEWVPELLVPDYPQSAWRATSPYAPDTVFGATNYVAIAGVGLDIARVDPNDPRVQDEGRHHRLRVGVEGGRGDRRPFEHDLPDADPAGLAATVDRRRRGDRSRSRRR